MKNKIILFLSLFAIILATSCTEKTVTDLNNPYFLVFEDLARGDSALIGRVKYISVDLSKSKIKDNSNFLNLMQEYCNKYNVTLLHDSIQSLEEKGLVKNNSFYDGVVIYFEDEKKTENELITTAMKWYSGRGAVCSSYTVKKFDNTWSITNTENEWIS